MPELYSDDNGNRVLIRHTGPAGKGLPSGGSTGQILVKASGNDFVTSWANPPNGTGAVTGPASAVSDNVAIFNGTTGKIIKDSGMSLANYASVSLVSTKVDKVTGYALSKNDFTDVLKTKVDAIQSTAGYRGSFPNMTVLNAFDFDPDPIPGDFCLLEVSGSPAQTVVWDDTNTAWTQQFPDATAMTGQEIADVLFDPDDAALWSVDNCRMFTEDDRNQLSTIQSLIDGGLGGMLTGVVVYAEKTENYTLTTKDRTINCTSGSFTLTLPTAVGDTGRTFTIKNSGPGTITIVSSDGVQLIDDNPVRIMSIQRESITLQSTGTGWIII
jgi:hypothetical protein